MVAAGAEYDGIQTPGQDPGKQNLAMRAVKQPAVDEHSATMMANRRSKGKGVERPFGESRRGGRRPGVG